MKLKHIKVSSPDIHSLNMKGLWPCQTTAKLREGDLVCIERKRDCYFVEVEPTYLICRVKLIFGRKAMLWLWESYDKNRNKIIYTKDKCRFFEGHEFCFTEKPQYIRLI